MLCVLPIIFLLNIISSPPYILPMNKVSDVICCVFLALCLLFNIFPLQHSSEVFNITSEQPLSQGQALTSLGQNFELGFFSPNNSINIYVGIWYRGIFPHTVVWVANRDKQITDSIASLTISNDGNLRLVDGKKSTLWSTHITVESNSSVAVLLDNGNFFLKDFLTEKISWESFEDPGDTFLPGAVMRFYARTGERTIFTAWKNDVDPSPGNFLAGIAQQTPPQAFIWNGSKPYWRSGQWDKSKFIGVPEMNSSNLLIFSLIENTSQGDGYFSFTIENSSIRSTMFISSSGTLTFWINASSWFFSWKMPNTQCDIYGACGSFGVCRKSETLTCRCSKGFVPKSYEEWGNGIWTGGCKRCSNLHGRGNTGNIAAQDGKADMFWKVSGMKLPDFAEYVTLEDANSCRQWCLSNCSCTAYAFVNGIGCLVWAGDLLDMQQFAFAGEDLFLRIAVSDSDMQLVKLILGLTVAGIASIMLLGILVYQLCRSKHKKRVRKRDIIDYARDGAHVWGSYLKEQDSFEPRLFQFDSILAATDNFSTVNKLGQGGFGPVYKGKLEGKDVAIKRLSTSSKQGAQEFKNEIKMISKLQHRNLVKVIGCCIEQGESILVYEFMCNRSLDAFLFDSTKKSKLDWATRFNIVLGVAQGLAYIHHDSSLRIIHRDLKVSNILLDEKMNPKISDFSFARMFQGSQHLASTQLVVGTLGYMSAEQALGGIFSEKSDVFSFGVLVLEIVSGKRNHSPQSDDEYSGLIAYAWKLWSQNKGLDLADGALAGSFCSAEVMRCIQIGLPCVQCRTAERSMSAVVSMLSCEAELPEPKEPLFAFESTLKGDSTNEVTLSMVQGR